MDFDQFVIRPEIFDMLNQQQDKRNKKMGINNSGVNDNRSGYGGSQNNVSQGDGRMVNNFIEDN